MKARVPLMVLSLLLGTCQLSADAVYYPAANVTVPSMGVPTSPRALAMGGAGTALEGDLFSIAGNPAGLARLSGDLELSWQYASLNPDAGLLQEQVVIGNRVGPLGVLALGGSYMPLGRYDLRDDQGYSYGTQLLYDADMALAWANTFFGDRLSLGLEGDGAYQVLGGSWGLYPKANLGLGWHWNHRVNFAASLSNIKLYQGAADLGGAMSAGTSIAASETLNLLADVSYPFADVSMVRAGFEWRPMPYFALRAGWRQNLGGNDAELQNGPSAGIAATVSRISLDYAFVSYGYTASHRIAITVKFPERWIHAPSVVIEASGGTAAAKSFYDLGAGLEAKGHLVDALVAYKQCLQAAPDFGNAQERIDAVVRQLNLEGDGAAKNKEVEAVFRRYVEAGLAFAKGGEFNKAISSFEIALELDKKNIQVVEKLKEVRGRLDALVAQHMEAAAAALEGADLGSAVNEFYAALKVDPQNAGVKARLSTLRPKITAEIKRLHRKGIDAYVEDRLDEASSAWKAALALDPSDPENVGRDLQKAAKLKDLRK